MKPPRPERIPKPEDLSIQENLERGNLNDALVQRMIDEAQESLDYGTPSLDDIHQMRQRLLDHTDQVTFDDGTVGFFKKGEDEDDQELNPELIDKLFRATDPENWLLSDDQKAFANRVISAVNYLPHHQKYATRVIKRGIGDTLKRKPRTEKVAIESEPAELKERRFNSDEAKSIFEWYRLNPANKIGPHGAVTASELAILRQAQVYALNRLKLNDEILRERGENPTPPVVGRPGGEALDKAIQRIWDERYPKILAEEKAKVYHGRLERVGPEPKTKNKIAPEVDFGRRLGPKDEQKAQQNTLERIRQMALMEMHLDNEDRIREDTYERSYAAELDRLNTELNWRIKEAEAAGKPADYIDGLYDEMYGEVQDTARAMAAVAVRRYRNGNDYKGADIDATYPEFAEERIRGDFDDSDAFYWVALRRGETKGMSQSLAQMRKLAAEFQALTGSDELLTYVQEHADNQEQDVRDHEARREEVRQIHVKVDVPLRQGMINEFYPEEMDTIEAVMIQAIEEDRQQAIDEGRPDNRHEIEEQFAEVARQRAWGRVAEKIRERRETLGITAEVADRLAPENMDERTQSEFFDAEALYLIAVDHGDMARAADEAFNMHQAALRYQELTGDSFYVERWETEYNS